MKKLIQKELTYLEYDKISTVPFNRDVLLRLKKAMKKFKELRPEHLVVHIGVLAKDSVYHGVTYKKGVEYVVDSNTRKYFWQKGLLEKPEILYATFHTYDTMDDMWEGYNTFDSVTSTESSAEKLTGQAILLGVEFSSTKLKKGGYVTALNFASTGIYPEKFPKTFSGQTNTVEKLTLFKEELIILDEANLGQKVGQSVLTAFLMALKCHKIKGTEDKVIDFIKKFEECYSDCTSKDKDGVTHAVEEIYKQQPGIFGWGSSYNDLPPQISFVLQNIDNYVLGVKTQRYVAKPATKDSIGMNYYSSYSKKHGHTALSTYLKKAA